MLAQHRLRCRGGRLWRELADLLREVTIAPDDPALLQPAILPDQAVHTKGVGDFVRQHDAGDRFYVAGRVFPPHDVSQITGPVRLERLPQTVRVLLDQPVLQCGATVRRFLRQPADDVPGQPADAGAVLADDERVWAVESLPALGDLPRQGDAEERVRLGGGEKVAGPAGAPLRRSVVAPLRVVERQLHEAGKGNASACRVDLRSHGGDELRVIGVSVCHGFVCRKGRVGGGHTADCSREEGIS